MSDEGRRFRGFAVIERPGGSLIWGTFRPTRAEAWATYERNNPAVTGFPTTGRLVEVEISVQAVEVNLLTRMH